MDAGPGINFLSLNKERLLFSVLGALCVPEVVEAEILRKARQEERFAAAARVWKKLPQRLLEVLSDDVTDELAAVVHRITGLPMQRRIRTGKDLGEIMVISHAVVAAERGDSVIVLLDDGGGRRMLAVEQRRLERLRSFNSSIGQIGVIGTHTVLEKAAGTEFLPDCASMRELYGRLRGLDDGLVPVESTGLLALPCWKNRSATHDPES